MGPRRLQLLARPKSVEHVERIQVGQGRGHLEQVYGERFEVADKWEFCH